MATLLIGMFRGAPQYLAATGFIVGLFLFLFAVPGTYLLGIHSEEFRDDEIIQDQWGNTMRSMFTLFRLMTLDNWSDVVRPIVKENNGMAIYFVVFMLLAVFFVSNVITAVLVERTIKAAAASEAEIARVEKKSINKM